MAEMPLRFKLNGADAEIRIEPDELLVDVLRDKLGMLGHWLQVKQKRRLSSLAYLLFCRMIGA